MENECKISVENTKLLAEVEHYKKEFHNAIRSNDEVREKEMMWFSRYEVIMCNLMGKNITQSTESGYDCFEACMNDFIKAYCAEVGVEVPEDLYRKVPSSCSRCPKNHYCDWDRDTDPCQKYWSC